MCVGMHAYMYTIILVESKYSCDISGFQLHRTATPTIPAPQPQKSAIVESKYGKKFISVIIYYLSLYESTLAVYRSKSGVVEVDQIKMGTFQEHTICFPYEK